MTVQFLSRAGRRLQKLRRDPQGFLLQSRFVPLRALGKVFAWQLDRNVRRYGAGAAGASVGIIVTVYNGADWIGAALTSLAGQTHKTIQVIVIDDASTDATTGIVADFVKRDSRFSLIVNAHNCGPYYARNRALEQLTTPFVTFLDADDTAHPARIARQLGFLLSHPRAVACVCSGVRVNAAGDAITINGREARMEPSTLFFHRAPVLEKIGYFDTVRFAGDAEYFGRLRAVFGEAAIARQHEVLLTASFRPDSLTHKGPGAQSWSMGASPVEWTRANSPERMAYAHEFTAWHRRIKNGESSPFCAARPQVRPFHAPAGMAITWPPADFT